MFAPVGCKPLEEVLDDVYDVIDDVLNDRKDEFDDDGKRRHVPGGGHLYRTSVYFGVAVGLINLPENPVSLCSPAGVLVRPTWHIWVPQPRFQNVTLPSPDSTVDEIRKFIFPMSKGYFSFIDAGYWTVSVPDLRGQSEAWSGGCNVTEASLRLKELHGWSLCVSDVFTVEKLLAALDLNALSESPRCQGRGRGRPALVPEVARVLRVHFNNERGDMSWKELAIQVASILGRRVSDSTVQRAIRHNMAANASKIENFSAKNPPE